MENILELQSVSKTFPKSDFTLDNVSFSVPYGSILGFVGENGAGKTTTIGCILNTVSKDSGTVRLFGKEMLDADTDMREKIGVVYDGDNFPLYWTANQLSQVMAGLYANWDHALFQKYLEDFRLPTKQKIRHYSRGMTMKPPAVWILLCATKCSTFFSNLCRRKTTPSCCPPISQATWKRWQTISPLSITESSLRPFPKTTWPTAGASCAAGRASSTLWIPGIFSLTESGIFRLTCWCLTQKKHSANIRMRLWIMLQLMRLCCFW